MTEPALLPDVLRGMGRPWHLVPVVEQQRAIEELTADPGTVEVALDALERLGRAAEADRWRPDQPRPEELWNSMFTELDGTFETLDQVTEAQAEAITGTLEPARAWLWRLRHRIAWYVTLWLRNHATGESLDRLFALAERYGPALDDTGVVIALGSKGWLPALPALEKIAADPRVSPEVAAQARFYADSTRRLNHPRGAVPAAVWHAFGHRLTGYREDLFAVVLTFDDAEPIRLEASYDGYLRVEPDPDAAGAARASAAVGGRLLDAGLLANGLVLDFEHATLTLTVPADLELEIVWS